MNQLPKDLQPLLAFANQSKDSIIELYPSIDSTNNRCKQILIDQAHQQSTAKSICVLADHQTSGRGRLGRSWCSPQGVNLYTSWGFYFANGQVLSGLSLALGLAIHKVVKALGVGQAQVKWPNDLITPQGKLAGVLIETCPLDQALGVIIGIGLNVNLMVLDMNEDYSMRWTSLQKELGYQMDRAAVALELHQAVTQCVEQFRQAGWQAFQADWPDADGLFGSAIEVHGASGQIALEGIAQGVDQQGQLLLKTASGQLEPIVSGEIYTKVRKK